MQRVKSKAPAAYKAQVEDTEKRLNILFDLMNNESLPATGISQLTDLTTSLQNREFDQAMSVHADLMKSMESGTNWLVSTSILRPSGKLMLIV